MRFDLREDLKRLMRPRTGARLDIATIARKATRFKTKLDAVKARIKLGDPGWYPYDSLANFSHLDELLREDRRLLLDLAGNEPVLDIGCADGALSFFLESLNCPVDAVDHPATNYNEMRGVRALKEALHSCVEIHAVDLDSQFNLPRERYGLAFFLGVLYHLKNPYYVLETLARRTRYCVLSTRIAGFAPDKKTNLRRMPVAYLLDEEEANSDSTNYWIFSDAGLRRLLKRTGWEIRDCLTTGNTADSDPVSRRGDERAFCLLESRFANLMRTMHLLEGWHPLEDGRWRWTERRFSVLLLAPVKGEPATLQLRFTLPDAVLVRLESVTLAATVNGVALPKTTYASTGDHLYTQNVPAGVLTGDAAQVDFELDQALPPTARDRRELGVLVPFGAGSSSPVMLF